jgi:alpha-beta hydrolase superfamily lysophospholipase
MKMGGRGSCQAANAGEIGSAGATPSHPIKRRHWLLRIFIAFGLAIAFWLLSSYAVAYRFTRRLHTIHPEPTPAISWGTIESFRLSTVDGEDIGAWYVEGRLGEPVVLLLHGHGGNRGHGLRRAEMMASRGCSAMMISLRANGDSTGNFDDIGYSARHDVVAAVEWIEKNHPKHPVVIWGQSMGAAAAIFAAQELGERVNGYILECPYQDLHTAVRHRTEYFLPTGLDRLAYLGLLTVSPLVMPDANKISLLDSICNVPASTPVLILAGGSDRRARPEEARAIYDRVQSHGQLVVFEGADHLQLMRDDPKRYRRLVEEFLTRAQSNCQ